MEEIGDAAEPVDIPRWSDKYSKMRRSSENTVFIFPS